MRFLKIGRKEGDKMLYKLHHLKNDEGGFTLIELLIVVVIIGILASVAAPAYSRYIALSRAGEATQVLTAMIEYGKSYADAHDGNYPNDPLWYQSLTPNPGTDSGIYFDYSWDAATSTITATGNGTDAVLDSAQWISFTLPTETWSSSGAMTEVHP